MPTRTPPSFGTRFEGSSGPDGTIADDREHRCLYPSVRPLSGSLRRNRRSEGMVDMIARLTAAVDLEDVAGGIFEPCHLDDSAVVDVAVAGRTGKVVVLLEAAHATGLQLPHRLLDGADGPYRRGCLVRTCQLRLVDDEVAGAAPVLGPSGTFISPHESQLLFIEGHCFAQVLRRHQRRDIRVTQHLVLLHVRRFLSPSRKLIG